MPPTHAPGSTDGKFMVMNEPFVQVIVHPKDQREAVPLSIHHLPLAVSFALFKARCGTCTAVTPV